MSHPLRVQEWPNGLGYDVGPHFRGESVETPRGEIWKLGDGSRAARTWRRDASGEVRASRYLRVPKGHPLASDPIALVLACESAGTPIHVLGEVTP